jgi:hypothetical protein
MAAISRRRSQRPDGNDDPQPSVRAFGIAALAHRLDHLARYRRGVVAVLRDPLMSGAVDVEIGDGHSEMVTLSHTHTAYRWPGSLAIGCVQRDDRRDQMIQTLMIRTTIEREDGEDQPEREKARPRAQMVTVASHRARRGPSPSRQEWQPWAMCAVPRRGPLVPHSKSVRLTASLPKMSQLSTVRCPALADAGPRVY